VEPKVVHTPESLQTRRAQMFPVLSDAQVARVARVAAQADFAPGSLVFGEGDTETPFFVVLEGEIEVLAPHGAMDAVVTVHRCHEFTGEVTLLNGRRALVQANITLHTNTRIVALGGDSNLEQVIWDTDGVHTTAPIRHIFSMTGAKPNTGWLQGCLQLDDKGFVITGVDRGVGSLVNGAARPSYQFETSLRNAFAVGDVRAGSVKRVAASVGEGSACVQVIHRAIAE